MTRPRPEKPPTATALGRWVGGKRWLPKLFPEKFPRLRGRANYYEPCVGGGALFFACFAGTRAVLGDTNPRLISTYIHLRDNPEPIIDLLDVFARDLRTSADLAREKAYFTDVRRRMNEMDPSEPVAAAAFLFMLRAGFNGVYRVNSGGGCNTPYGEPKATKDLVRAAELRMISKALKRAVLRAGDFTETTSPARNGDFVFFDPPYVGDKGEHDFVGYSAGGFAPRDRKRLGVVLRDLDQRGVRFLLTDKCSDSAQAVYGLWNVVEVDVRRSVGAKAESRGVAREIIVSNE